MTAPSVKLLALDEVLDGKYRIDALLGAGGMGTVYRATHLGTTRVVAVKVIRPQFSADEEFADRFRREAAAAGRLRHPNVVDVTDFGVAETSGGRVAYLVMEYLDGCSLAAVLARERRLPLTSVVDIVEQVCSAVDEAHRSGVVHRDLKPDNIWLEPNRRGGHTLKLLDFGLARVRSSPAARPGAQPSKIEPPAPPAPPAVPLELEDRPTVLRRPSGTAGALEGAVTQAGSIMGTPLYMSPEQCRGEEVDWRTDIYSIGVITYEMLAGEPPFRGTAEQVLRSHATAAPVPLLRGRGVPSATARVVQSAMDGDPAARPPTALGFASALRASAEGGTSLFRQAVGLYAERFRLLLGLSAVAYVPLIALVTALVAADALTTGPPRSGLNLVGLLFFAAVVTCNLFAYAVLSAGLAPVVVQAIAQPLRVPGASLAWRAIRRHGRVLLLAFVWVVALAVLGTALLVVPGILVVVGYALHGPVIVVEGGGVRTSLRRARQLVAREPRTAAVITALQLALPISVWIATVDHHLAVELDDSYRLVALGFSLTMSGRSSLWQLLNILVTPLAAVMSTLLYLRLRQAGAETIREAADQIAGLA